METTMGTTKIKREAPDKITKWDVLWCYLKFNCAIWLTQSNVNRAATALTQSMSSILRKLYKREEDFKEALSRHMEFFLTEYTLGAAIVGLLIAMEEQRANELYEKGESSITPESVSAIKASLMGPFAGIGDTMWASVFWTFGLALTIPMALEGNLWAIPIAWFICEGVQYPLGLILIWYGYSKGKSFILQITQSNSFNKLLTIAAIVSMVVFGQLTGQLVSFSTPGLMLGETVFTDFLDSIIPGLPILAPLFIMYYLGKKKNVNIPIIIIGIVVICVVLGLFGVFTAPAETASLVNGLKLLA